MNAWFPIVALAMVGLIAGVAQLLGFLPLPGDAFGDWNSPPGTYELGIYVYSPVLTQLLEPLRWANALPVFIVVLSVINFASISYIFGRWAILVLLLFFPAALIPGAWWTEPITIVLIGNVTMPMLAALIAGLRQPGWLAVPLLTKIGPGVIGFLWLAFRREWRALRTGLLLTCVIVVVFAVLDPGAWLEYVRFALANAGSSTDGPAIVGPPLAIRFPLAVVLVAVAARFNQPRLVPLAAAVATIGLYGWGTFFSVAVGALSPRLASNRDRPSGSLPGDRSASDEGGEATLVPLPEP